MRALLASILLWQMQWVETWEDEARFRLTCPEASCWHYWNGTCYCLEENQEGTWTEALKFCKRYTFTELVTLNSIQEKNWILDLPLDNFWIGLNNLEETQSFSWSEGTRANTSSWVQLSNPLQPNTCVKVSKHSLVAVSCDTEAHWICQRSAVADRYQEHKGKVLLSPKSSMSQVHTDLISAKIACLELREQCTGITTWNNGYALARGTVLLKSKEKQSVAYVKSDCSLGYFGTNCSSVCNRCYGDELCNPYTGDCDIFHSCRSQDSPAVCEQALNSIWCPQFSGWRYWEKNCYYFSAEKESSWIFARKQCRRFRSTDLIWIDSKSEMDWISSAASREIWWIGLNSRKRTAIWVWSDSKSAAKELQWLKLEGNLSGRCVGFYPVNNTALKIDCSGKHKWICKRKERVDLFDLYTDMFLSGPLDPDIYTGLSTAVVDCLSDSNCTGIVQDSRFFRRTRGIDEIITSDENVFTYKKRECSLGYFGNNCVLPCKKCYGGFRCNSITGNCPERLYCHGQFKGELCELGLKNPKCPHNAPWWFYGKHCYYFEMEKKGNFDWAEKQCSYYKDSYLVRIGDENEKKWLDNMLEKESWIGLRQRKTRWEFVGGGGAVHVSKYTWLWDFPSTRDRCALMVKGRSFQALQCAEQHFYICKIQIADVSKFFTEYPAKIMLSPYGLAHYEDIEEARYHCIMSVNCTGISSWPLEHFPVTGTEMVLASAEHVVHLKTSCTVGRYGYACKEECPECRNSLLCNMMTGLCDEKTTCLDQSSLESCSGSSVSERCPDMNKWRYWNRYCYYFVSSFKTWNEANSSCSRFRGSELLWIEDKDDLKWLKMFIIQPIWVGLQEINKDGVWAWSHEDSAEHSLTWMNLHLSLRWKGCAELTHGGDFYADHCYEKKKSACKRPAERDLDIFSGFWDTVLISRTLSLSANSSYNTSKDECIKQGTACLGYGLWKNGYFLLNGNILVGGGFGPSVTFLKSGLYSLKCSLGVGWWYWQGTCYWIEKNKKVTWKEALLLCRQFKNTSLLQLDSRREKVWLQEMINKPMWVGLKWHENIKEWLWGNGTSTNTSRKWLHIQGNTLDSCGTLIQRSLALRSAKCGDKFNFICKRKEDLNIFEKYKGHIIPQREQVLPKSFSDLESAEEECIFERTICTGVVFSQGLYHMVSGKEIFKSLKANDILYLKSVCSAGFHGTSCQSTCQKCKNELPCNPFTGKCIAPGLTKCSIDSSDPKCTEPVFTGLCPKIPQWYYFSKSCYYVENIKKDTWDNAKIACQGFKKTDLVKITNSREKMWVQYKGDDSWIGLTFYKRTSQYLWVDNSTSVFQNAWVIRRNRRYIPSDYDCGVAFKYYLSVVDCSHHRKWICKREEVVDLFTEHDGRAFYLPDGISSKYCTLAEAKQACLASQTCTGVTNSGKCFLLHNNIDLYNTRNKTARTLIKSICSAGRHGEICEHMCPKCDDDVPCNPHTGLCSETVFCSKNDSSFTCETGTLIGGRCPVEDNWIYWRGSCYYIHKGENKKWRPARYMCRHYSNADLLWITTKAEKKFILSVLPNGTFWIGLNGIKFCTHLRWSYINASDLDTEWLYKKSWSIFWKCCVYLTVPKGSLIGTGCIWNNLWICKSREEEIQDFRRFDGYFLVGFTKDNKSVNHTSLMAAFQHCRAEREHCTGIQRIRNIYTTSLAKRMVLIIGNDATLYTVYLKSACALRYYGAACGMICSCNGSESCNPLNGQCAENEQCNENHLKNDCQQDVIHLRCPKDPGWWYWNNSCYYVEPTKLLKWEEAKNFCMAYHETKLLPQPRNEEKEWLTTMLKNEIWIDPELQEEDMPNSKDSYKQVHFICTRMKLEGTFESGSCSSSATWVCKRSVDTNMFWEYPKKMLMFPLSKRTYENKEFAKSACLLEKECTGISYWKKKYRPVSGKELISTTSNQDTAYIKTACSEGHYGAYCQDICPECPEDRPCNRLTGKCAEELTCMEKKHMHLCKFKLKSKFCYHSWIYFNKHCYYIPTFGVINKNDAEYMCSQFKGAELISLTTIQEKNWVAKIISENIWLHAVGPAFFPKRMLSTMEKKITQRVLTDIEELCLQMLPGEGHLVTVPCSDNASWICKAPLAFIPVDAPEKWWMSLVTSTIATIIVLIVTVFVTFKYGV
ncbi:uncharacterized protein LOC120311809 isoform X3 [Crotalus tigris]|uniref:uncharacterized protein LOC120311809 isoform X3 n=1 Tax=Crotalus tigris TaxID=88082 RepID=UPI00192F913A|nr:uncharacterized protein LOC120311809 isoform X3 [Crotalus tigris]